MSRAIMQQALDALKNGKRVRSGEGGTKYQPDLEDDAIAAIEAELAKPEQEPVAWETFALKFANGQVLSYEEPKDLPSYLRYRPLYAAPPRKEWVGLTDDEMPTLTTGTGPITMLPWRETKAFIRAIEAKLKEKNTTNQ